uniref:U2 snRNP-associated SURP motif-containing protein n=1 Tax=Elaeophora elaphi TaxID=1147741 RepID=A0A158Q7U9_9BILA
MDRYRRRRKEDEEAELSKAYEQFREAFEDGTSVASKSFIRAAVVNANKVMEDMSSKPSIYNPKIELTKKASVAPNSFEQAKRIAEEKAKRMMEEARKANLTTSRPPRPGKAQQKSRTSNLEAFKEELKSMQEEREQRRHLRSQMEQMGMEKEALDRIAPLIDNPYLHGTGEYDNDPNTTNIYLSNLSLEIKIEDLYNTFGTFGPLASAKILYPREEDRKREHLCGFIAFMIRKDTDRAIQGMQGKYIRGSEVRMSLAKPVSIPPQPIYVPPALLEFAMPDPPTGLPFNAKPRKCDLDALLKKCPLPRLGSSLPESGHGLEEYQKMLRNAVVRVVVPTERSLLVLIHRTIEFLVREGPLFEAMLMGRERHNPVYRFLFDNHHPAHVYYRWKLYSILQGETPQTWRLQKFRMFDEGSWWQPPPHNILTGGMPECLYHTAFDGGLPAERPVVKSRKRKYSSSEDEEEDRKEIKTKWRGVLSTAERDELEDILRGLLPEKSSIADAMVWCVEHATCAKEISQCLHESLTIDETPLHKKIARLYLVSDILANCAARVRDVFYYRQYIGDLMPEIFRKEGEVSEDDIDGAPIEEGPEETITKKESIFEEEDIDGVPIEEDTLETQPKKAATFKRSQWDAVDPSVVASQAVTTSKWDLLENGKDDETAVGKIDQEDDIDGAPIDDDKNGSEDGECPDEDDDDKITSSLQQSLNSSAVRLDEERRKILREIEVKVVKYQDELESQRCEDIPVQVEKYRASLLKQMEEKLDALNEQKDKKKKKRMKR